jgi:hypothetical protein
MYGEGVNVWRGLMLLATWTVAIILGIEVEEGRGGEKGVLRTTGFWEQGDGAENGI